jgi:hypothetical protein
MASAGWGSIATPDSAEVNMARTPAVETRKQRCIRAIFLQRRESYGPGEVQQLTGIQPERVRGAIQQGELDGEIIRNGFRIRWPQLAALALDVWSIEEVERTLGEDAAQVIPPLVRTATLAARVPRYQVLMLETLARRRGCSADAVVADALLTLAEECAEELESDVPGITEAIHFPEAIAVPR